MAIITVNNVKLKQIPGFPGYYASKCGKIYSTRTNKGHGPGRFLKQTRMGKNYLCVRLNTPNNPRYVHRLVLMAWVGPCPSEMEACHNDGDTHNNWLKNLRWDTRNNNRQDSIKHGTIIGENHSQNKLKEQDVRMIIYMYRTGEFTQKEIGNIYNVCQGNISAIINKKTWRHIWQ